VLALTRRGIVGWLGGGGWGRGEGAGVGGGGEGGGGGGVVERVVVQVGGIRKYVVVVVEEGLGGAKKGDWERWD
jgi:hypothetical protein